jgi:uncharacterized protein YjbI with pentapeptide repeats
VEIAATLMHLAIPLPRLSWQSKAALSLGAGLVSAGVIAVVGTPRRPFDLFRADLANQWLIDRDLTGADLKLASLRGAYLITAHLHGADRRWAGDGLTQAQLDAAFGDAATQLP